MKISGQELQRAVSMEKVVTCLLEAKSGSARGRGWSCSTRTPLGQSCLQHPQMGDEAWKRQGLGKETLFGLLATPSAGFLACSVALKIRPERSMLV